MFIILVYIITKKNFNNYKTYKNKIKKIQGKNVIIRYIYNL